MVVPNLGEAEEVLGLGRGGESVEAAEDARPRALAAAEALVSRGARAAVVTAAAAGAALFADGAATWIPAPAIAEVRNPIGAGDVFTSALAAALERGEPLEVRGAGRRGYRGGERGVVYCGRARSGACSGARGVLNGGWVGW